MTSIPFEKSFACHEKAKYWSTRNEKSPEDYALNSHKKMWFDCECGHKFESTLLNINQANNWCPYCSKHAIRLCEDDACHSCFENSFASHPRAIYWSSKNDLPPRKLFKCKDRKTYFFDCPCGHEIKMTLKQISSQGHWCSYCSHQKLCEDNDCNMCFNNSFASVDKSQFLKDKSLNPRTLFKSTNKKFEFQCDTCNKGFHSQLSGVTKGVWCPHCFNKTESILFQQVQNVYTTLQRQFKVEWCKNKTYLPFDFVIHERKVIIELDGKQHFEQIGRWQSPEENQRIDLYKMRCANSNGYSVIRLLQKDVWFNKYDWLTELIQNIEKITNEDRVQNIYMCKNNEYKDFVA